MTGAHDRRAFLRELLRGASRAAGELDAFRARAEAAQDEWEPASLDAVADAAFVTVPATPTTRVATLEELRSLCAELCREDWADEAVALAQRSTRLTRGGSGHSWLGGCPEAPTPFVWPTWDGAELTFLAQVRLDVLPDSPLPRHGALLFFFALDRVPPGYAPDDADACRVLHVGDGPAERVVRESLSEIPVTVSEELVLPLEPMSLTLDDPGLELELWTELRRRLAAAQGVEAEDCSADYHALHRMLGYPDTLADGMEDDADLVSRGIDLSLDPYSDRPPPGGSDWRLLLQLSNDDELGIVLGVFERLFVWIRDDDLRAGRFDRVRAFVR